MKASEILIKKIKEFEGCKLYAYRDSKGVPTIGIGHTSGVKMGQAITMQQAESFLREDLATAESQVNALGVCTTQGQFDALVDFVYNLGIGNLKSSTLLKYIKNGVDVSSIQHQFLIWNKCRVQGKLVPLPGLTKRREWEANRYADA